MNNNENIVQLIDEQGESVFFEHLMTLTYGEQDYIILATLEDEKHDEEDEEELEIVILRVEQDTDGNDIYVGIEDESELKEIFNAYGEIINSDI